MTKHKADHYCFRREAAQKAARLAMGELVGGCDPFTAVAFRKTLPLAWQREVEEVILFVYHHEGFPAGLFTAES